MNKMLNIIVIVLWVLWLTARLSYATLPVVDYNHIAQDAGNEVVNLAKWVKTEVDAAQTQLNTLNTYENTVLQVARLGNPAALQNIPVVSSIAELVGSGQRLLIQYEQIKNLINPQYLQGSLNSLTSAYQLQSWNPMAPGAYRFPAASFAISQSVQDQMTALEKQRQQLEQQRDATLKSLQSATTTADVQKYSAGLVGVNGALAEIAARSSELAQKSEVQQQQLNAGQAVQRQQITEQTAASFGSDINASINTLDSLSSGFGTVPHWPEGK
jgi:hypothetical protein